MKTFLSIIRNIPEPLKKFLKEKGAYKRYVKNCLEDKSTLSRPNRAKNMGYAFYWDTDAWLFWNNLHNEFLNLKK